VTHTVRVLVTRNRALGLVAVVAYVLVGLVTLSHVPLVWMDEPWYTQPAWSFATNGTFAQPMFPGLHGLDVSNVAYGRIYLAAVAAVFKVFGVGPFQARLISFVAGLFVIGITYLIGRRLWDASAGVIAALLLAVSQVFVLQTHDARPEILQLALSLAALWALLRSEDSHRLRWLFAAGLISAMTADVHLNGVITPIAIGAFLLARGGRTTTLEDLAALSAGVGVGVIWWFAVHVLPDPGLFADQWAHVWSSILPVTTLLFAPLAVLLGEVRRYLVVALFMGNFTWILPVLSGVGIWILLRYHRDSAVRALVVAMGVHVVAMALIVSNKTETYAVLIWPSLCLVAGRWIEVALPRRLRITSLSAVVMVSILALLRTAVSLWPADYDAFVGRLRNVIPDGSIVQGEPTFWFGFVDDGYVADHYFKAVSPYGDAVTRLGISYIVADEFFMRQQLEVDKSIDRSEVYRFLADHATLVAIVHDPFYGTSGATGAGDHLTKIYMVHYVPATGQ
jgi:4-amino-4-deoxy-L-arabinose transferase-like glycosyltransferase